MEYISEVPFIVFIIGLSDEVISFSNQNHIRNIKNKPSKTSETIEFIAKALRL
jgi:hypothetical protein